MTTAVKKTVKKAPAKVVEKATVPAVKKVKKAPTKGRLADMVRNEHLRQDMAELETIAQAIRSSKEYAILVQIQVTLLQSKVFRVREAKRVELMKQIKQLGAAFKATGWEDKLPRVGTPAWKKLTAKYLKTPTGA